MKPTPIGQEWKALARVLPILIAWLVFVKLGNHGEWIAIKLFAMLGGSMLMVVWLIVAALRHSKPWR
ncbi:MAG TPA: hypothetical protein VK689_22325 [Armatimonadota bacterium]|nr:hypothetical protein [Armatimonadota bacterium]